MLLNNYFGVFIQGVYFSYCFFLIFKNLCGFGNSTNEIVYSTKLLIYVHKQISRTYFILAASASKNFPNKP